jgi:hypothetical protein
MILLLISALVPLTLAGPGWQCNGPDYIALPAQDKAQMVWENCFMDQTSQDWMGALDIGQIMFEDMCPTFNFEGDQMIVAWTGNTRRKYIHPVGAVGRVEWVDLGDHPYTGIFQGSTEGITRFSLALQPDEALLNTAPGMGLKFLRDGMDSANLVAMYAVDGQESWNFFENDFTTHIPGINGALNVLGAKFYTATNNIRQVGTNNWSRYGQDGVEVADPVFPYRLVFRPTGEIEFSDTYVHPFTEDLKTIPKDTTLYQIFALDQPEELGGMEKHIGDLILRSEMITSLWGDQNLYFRHDDMAHDLVIKPEWNEFTPQFGLFFEDDPSQSSKCPYSRK